MNIIITKDYIPDSFSIILRTQLYIGDEVFMKNNVNICISNTLIIAEAKFASNDLLFLAECRILIFIFLQVFDLFQVLETVKFPLKKNESSKFNDDKSHFLN